MKETVDKTMNAMTLEEKVGQLFMARVPEQNQVADIQNYHLGGYLLFDRDMEGKGQAEVKQAIMIFSPLKQESRQVLIVLWSPTISFLQLTVSGQLQFQNQCMT